MMQLYGHSTTGKFLYITCEHDVHDCTGNDGNGYFMSQKEFSISYNASCMASNCHSLLLVSQKLKEIEDNDPVTTLLSGAYFHMQYIIQQIEMTKECKPFGII
jgi:hydroxylamine reductase (hybrid-cluster protein)